jgi:HK97 family phage major capsid protein
VKISEELLEDEAANLGGFLSNHVARQFGLWENDAFFVGTGSNEPDGVFESGTAGVSSDFATTIAASEIPELFFKLTGEYRDSPNCYWAMQDSTLGLIQGLDGDPFKFIPTPAGNMMQLWSKPVRTSSKIAAHTSGLKSIVFGDFSYYMIAENKSLRVTRNPYLYQANGQVGFFWNQRVGGAVLQAEAFQYMTAA